MWSMTIAFVLHEVWPLLPEITIGLKFCTALIGFVVAVVPLVRRVLRLDRRRRIVAYANRTQRTHA